MIYRVDALPFSAGLYLRVFAEGIAGTCVEAWEPQKCGGRKTLFFRGVFSALFFSFGRLDFSAKLSLKPKERLSQTEVFSPILPINCSFRCAVPRRLLIGL